MGRNQSDGPGCDKISSLPNATLWQSLDIDATLDPHIQHPCSPMFDFLCLVALPYSLSLCTYLGSRGPRSPESSPEGPLGRHKAAWTILGPLRAALTRPVRLLQVGNLQTSPSILGSTSGHGVKHPRLLMLVCDAQELLIQVVSSRLVSPFVSTQHSRVSCLR